MHRPDASPNCPRLGHYLAMAGVAARRKAAEMVKAGRVTVDGVPLADPAHRLDPDAVVAVDGRHVTLAAPVAVMLHKPPGWTCTVSDRHAAKTVLELVSMPGVRLYPAGRLDRDSEGLLVLTNNGDYAWRLTHPRHGIRKTYEVTTAHPLSPRTWRRLLDGIEDDGEMLRAEQVMPLPDARCRLLLGEGRKREIRRMVRAVGGEVVRLRRCAIGNLELGPLAAGQWRTLSPAEIARSLAPGPPPGWFAAVTPA